MNSDNFTHIDEKGRARMVDVSEKKETIRFAQAQAEIELGEKAFNLLTKGEIAKGDVFAVARVAGIMAAKKVDELIPLCHPLPIQFVEIDFTPNSKNYSIIIESRVKLKGVTGVEMEALTAVSVAALTIYDMCKAVQKAIRIKDIKLIKKSGGKSGTWIRQGGQLYGSSTT